ncbi:hypothetical protein [Halomicrobium urmianum]|uniref:hypothetical protein n=1 Tax=Halomicrobium urmianum TaxID=1586233 RepID=UPI001CD93C88|nr:hypothetical protein [Halomicrobium urmianum]
MMENWDSLSEYLLDAYIHLLLLVVGFLSGWRASNNATLQEVTIGSIGQIQNAPISDPPVWIFASLLPGVVVIPLKIRDYLD